MFLDIFSQKGMNIEYLNDLFSVKRMDYSIHQAVVEIQPEGNS